MKAVHWLLTGVLCLYHATQSCPLEFQPTGAASDTCTTFTVGMTLGG